MSGSLYLGSNKVCPTIVSIKYEPAPSGRLLIRLPDGVIDSSNVIYINPNSIFSYAGIEFDIGGCTKLYNVNMYNYFYNSYSTQNNFIFSSGKLKEITGSSLQDWIKNVNFADGHTDIYFDELEAINGGSFFGDMFIDTNITSLHFPKLNDCSYSFFQAVNCSHLYLNSVTSTTFTGATISSLFSGLSNQTIHLPSNMSSVMPSISGYPDFGGTNTTILYDLSATE